MPDPVAARAARAPRWRHSNRRRRLGCVLGSDRHPVSGARAAEWASAIGTGNWNDRHPRTRCACSMWSAFARSPPDDAGPVPAKTGATNGREKKARRVSGTKMTKDLKRPPTTAIQLPYSASMVASHPLAMTNLQSLNHFQAEKSIYHSSHRRSRAHGTGRPLAAIEPAVAITAGHGHVGVSIAVAIVVPPSFVRSRQGGGARTRKIPAFPESRGVEFRFFESLQE